MAVPVGLAPGDIAYLGIVKPEPVSERPALCNSRSITERYTLIFPPNVSIESIPRGPKFIRSGIDFVSSYSRVGRTVTIDRKVRIQRQSRICGLQESRDWDDFYRVIQRELRSQIIYR
jgi:hypothetical protein